MKQKIIKIVKSKPGLLGREIAKVLCVDKREVNSLLARDSAGLYQDKETFRWYPSIIAKQHILEFTSDSWICEDLFENTFKNTGCFFGNEAEEYIIRFPDKCKILLIAGARIIALANQCVHQGKKITLDFEQCGATRTYLDRLGFFDHLLAAVNVLPNRPSESRAKRYSGNSENLVEIAAINPQDLDESIPKTLTNTFIQLTDDKYRTPIFTVFSELIGNVRDHSNSPIMGFAALQRYKWPKEHIQVVVSDSGLGILQTLKVRLGEHYPDLYRKLDFSKKETDAALLQKVFVDGQLSQFGSNPDGAARGLGLKKSQDYAARYNADITIRQKTLELKLIYRNSQLFEAKPKFDLPILEGTQVCFDFYLN
jgi:hypothetical protein